MNVMKRFHGTILTVLLCAYSAVYGADQAPAKTFAPTNPTTIDARDFDLKAGEDAVPAIRAALEACQEQGATKLIIPKGEHECHPDMATEKHLRVSNNDNGMKCVVFPLEGLKNFEIDGQGSRLVMLGHMVAIDVEGCENVTLRNFSIDWSKPFYFQGEVVVRDESTNSFDLKVFEECHYEIVAHEILFLEKPTIIRRTSWLRETEE